MPTPKLLNAFGSVVFVNGLGNTNTITAAYDDNSIWVYAPSASPGNSTIYTWKKLPEPPLTAANPPIYGK